MTKKNLKNPITVIRTPDKINQEYSELMTQMGVLETEKLNVIDNSKKHIENLDSKKDKIYMRTKELSIEMDEAQKELKRKEDEAKKLEPELPLDEAPANDT